MQEAQASLLAALQAGACVKAAACKWAQGEGMAAVLAKAKKASCGRTRMRAPARVCSMHAPCTLLGGVGASKWASALPSPSLQCHAGRRQGGS